MKPKILQAGLPLALSVAAFILAKIMERRNSVPKASSIENQVDSPPSASMEDFRDVESLLEEGEGKIIINRFLTENSQIQDPLDHEEQILALKRQIERLQEREWELTMRFLCYCHIKEEESRLLELRSRLRVEIARVEFLNWEVSLLEAETKRHLDLLVEYFRIVEQLEFLKSENRLLHREVKKLARKTKQQSRVIRNCNLKMAGIEEEISSNKEELEKRTTAINELDNEVRELQTTLNQVQAEKNELSEKLSLKLAEEQSSPSTSKSEAEEIAMEDYNQLVKELERLHEEQAAEVKELVYLRWSNACLRHELMRNHEQPEQNQNQNSSQSELDFESKGETREHASEHELVAWGEAGLGVSSGGSVSSKRPKILERLRRWVDGSEKIRPHSSEGEEHEIKCFGRHSVSHKAEESTHTHVHNKSNALAVIMN